MKRRDFLSLSAATTVPVWLVNDSASEHVAECCSSDERLSAGTAAHTAPAVVRKSYVDYRFGQLHLRMAQPTEPVQPSLVCLHHSPSTGHIFTDFMREMARDRAVFAPDTPGFGGSDPPPNLPLIADYAAALGDLLDARNALETCDIIGYHTGALIAIELAITRPKQVRKLVIVGLAAFNAQEQKRFSAQPWPRPVREDGAHLVEEWKRSMQWRGRGQTLEMIARGFAAKLSSGSNAWWGARAAMYYPTIERIRLVKQPMLILRPKDDLWDVSLRVKPATPQAQWKDMPQYGFGLFEVAPKEIAALVRDFCG
jgi:pimeloyl-ACP methyl ester carboxylesterase